MPTSVAVAARNLLSSERYYRRRASTPEALFRLLSELMTAIEECAVVDFDPALCIGALIPFLAPVGAQYGDTVADESDDPKDIQQTTFSGTAITALASIIRKFGYTSVRPGILAQLELCWKALCMGLRFYIRALSRHRDQAPVTEIDSPAHTFATIITVLHVYAEEDSLLALVCNTPGACNLVIELWVLEIQHRHLSAQLEEMFPESSKPTAAVLLQVIQRDASGHARLVPILNDLHIRSEMARVAVEHLRRTTHSIYQHAEIPADTMHAHLFHLNFLHATRVHPHLLSQNSVRVVTEALTAVTSRPFDSATAQGITDCIQQACAYLRQYVAGDGLISMNQSLEFGLLVGLLKAHPWLKEKGHAYEEVAALLTVHLPPYLIYASVLHQARQSIHVIHEYILKNEIDESLLKKWRVFEAHAHATSKRATGNEFVDITCDGYNCTNRAVLRCSSCWEAAYCSQICQMAVWNSHRAPCAARSGARQAGILPDLSEEDVQFALRVAQHDFEKHKLSICHQWIAAGTLPLTAGIDYSVFPSTVSTQVPEEVLKQMASDAAIYTVFPKGAGCKEYYMCDLGLTHAPGEPDEATIKVVVEMVKAQPVPVFLRISSS